MASHCRKMFNPCILHYKYEVKANERKNHPQILELDSVRKILNQRTYAGDTEMLFSITGTLIASVFLEWQFWVNMFIFWVTRWMKYRSTTNILPPLLSTADSICHGLTIFLVVFYLRLCYSRYCMQYDCSCAFSSCLFDCCSVARACMSKAGGWRLFRLLNAAHLLAYVGLNKAYNEVNMFDPLIEKYCLLTPVEVTRVKETGLVGESAHLEVIAWAMLSVKTEKLSDVQLQNISIALLTLRESLASLHHFINLPVPFSYVHCINFQVFLFLPLYSYTLAYSYNRSNSEGQPHPGHIVLSDSIIEFLYLFWYTVVILSLRTLAQRLQDPFGHCLEDFPIIRFITKTIAASSKIMCAPPFHRSCEKEEAGMFSAREPFGKIFEFERSSIVPPNELFMISVKDEFLYSTLPQTASSIVAARKGLAGFPWPRKTTKSVRQELKDDGCWCFFPVEELCS